MTHDEYLARLELWTDADAPAVLVHAESCAACRREARIAQRALEPLLPRRVSRAEEAARLAAAAAIIAVLILGIPARSGPKASPPAVSRYRIVGDASSVTAYTPAGIVVTAGQPAVENKETVR